MTGNDDFSRTTTQCKTQTAVFVRSRYVLITKNGIKLAYLCCVRECIFFPPRFVACVRRTRTPAFLSFSTAAIASCYYHYCFCCYYSPSKATAVVVAAATAAAASVVRSESLYIPVTRDRPLSPPPPPHIGSPPVTGITSAVRISPCARNDDDGSTRTQ